MKQQKLMYDCPLCERQHEVTIIEKEVQAMVKGKIVNYIATLYYCPDSLYEGIYFTPDYIMDENNGKAREAYEKEVTLSTSSEIKKI